MPTPGARILIVDDEPPLLKMIGLYLTRLGFSVTTMPSADRAWEAVESNVGELAAAVVDATLRGMRAEDLALRLLAANPTVCVILASGYPVDMTRLEAAGPGRVEFMQKPFASEMLARTLRRMIASQEKEI
jgi:DNA-binding NtrC family response regulator